jgi:hypothetical protein
MKSFKQFLSEDIHITGDFNGTIIMGGDQTDSQPQSVGEEFVADVVWEGNLYRMEFTIEGNLPSNKDLTEEIQGEYPGAIVQNVYPVEKPEKPEKTKVKIGEVKRYHPGKLEWI